MRTSLLCHLAPVLLAFALTPPAAAAAAFVNGIEALKKKGVSVKSLQEYTRP